MAVCVYNTLVRLCSNIKAALPRPPTGRQRSRSSMPPTQSASSSCYPSARRGGVSTCSPPTQWSSTTRTPTPRTRSRPSHARTALVRSAKCGWCTSRPSPTPWNLPPCAPPLPASPLPCLLSPLHLLPAPFSLPLPYPSHLSSCISKS